MKRCEYCKIEITGEREKCPLCQAELVADRNRAGDDYGERFKYFATVYSQHAFFFKIMIFISVVAAVAVVSINLILPETGLWSLFAVFGIISIWTSLFFAVRKRRNVPKGMLYQVVIVSGLCIAWDFATSWKGWSIDYVVPLLCIAVMITLAVLSRIMEWKIEHMIAYFLIDAVFGIVPIVFYFTGLLSVIIPSIICVACSLISIAAIIVFNGTSIKAELNRRFNI